MKKTLYLLLSFVSLLLFSCDPNHSEGDEPILSIDQTAFLRNLSETIIIPNYQNLNSSVQGLFVAADSFLVKTNQNNLEQLRANYKATYIDWQKVNFLEFGPATQLELKSNVNVYPTDVNQIELNITNSNTNLDALSNKAAKGFPALDYLLYHSSDSALLQEFTSQGRRAYLSLIINDLKNKINQVNADWSSYQNTFNSAQGTDIGSSTGLLVNALNQHIERYFRDGKIGIPLGVRSSGIALPDNAEAYYSGISFELINANFLAMKSYYLGGNGSGLDDYLVAANATDVNDIVNTQMAIIESKLSQFNSTMPDAIQNNNSGLLSTYQEIQKLIVYWKVDMPSRLGILITYQDNDGD